MARNIDRSGTDKPSLDRGSVMKQFGAPRRALPRRTGSRSAHLIDKATSLPNRIALMAEMDFILNTQDDHVGLVLVQVSGLPATGEPAGAISAAAGLNEAAARLRQAVRPTDLVGRSGPDEVGAALWGLAAPEFIQVVRQRVVRAFSRPILLTGSPEPLGITIGIGTSAPGMTAGEALAGARAILARSRPLPRSA